jgi:SRSO17 transposase
VEQGYRQLKRELGLDHFEGRNWNGFHHHAAMTFLAYGFLALERQRTNATAMAAPLETAEPLGGARRTSLPAVRRALQFFLDSLVGHANVTC